MKLGSNHSVRIDVRVLAATNRNLEEMLQRGAFREDLYYRLNVIETVVPPLRERRDEILPLTDFFMAKYSERYHRPPRVLPPEVRQRKAFSIASSFTHTATCGSVSLSAVSTRRDAKRHEEFRTGTSKFPRLWKDVAVRLDDNAPDRASIARYTGC